MNTFRTRHASALASLALVALVAGACGDDDDSSSGAATSTTAADSGDSGDVPDRSTSDDGVFDPAVDDATVTICDSYFEYIDSGDETALLNINLSSDVLALDDVRNASNFLLENPGPSDEESQRQHEDALTILQSDIADSGICDGGEETGDGEPTEGDLVLAMCDEYANLATTGDTTSAEVILSNAEDIGLSQEGIDAVSYLLEDPDGANDPEQHEAAIQLGDEAFAEICP